MRYVLVSTSNVLRYQAAADALEARLADPEIMGIGLIFGRPGLGKTMWMSHYKSQMAKIGRIRVFMVRARTIWTESSMLKDLLMALGQTPRQYRKDLMFDQLLEALQEPAIFLVDEIDAIAESRKLIAIVKDIHDMSGSAILMVGEQRVDGLLRRYEAFYNRLNSSAIVNVTTHTAEDIAAVITQRCEMAVDPEVCREIHNSVGKSMRSVVDKIRQMERHARTNGLKRIGMAEYSAVNAVKSQRMPKKTDDRQLTLGEAAVG